MNHKSAINWDYLSQARRLQDKLQQYFGLVEQIRALEDDPELQAALAALGGGLTEKREIPTPPAPAATGLRSASMVPQEKRRRGEGERLLSLAQPGEQFDARHLLDLASMRMPDLTMDPKQANDHLRRFSQAGRIRLVVKGKRGQTGSMPIYELVTDSTSAAENRH